jgi:hypothetical protein
LLEFWQETLTATERELKQTLEDLLEICSPEEMTIIKSLIKQATTAKEQDLKQKREGKERNIRKTGASGGRNRSRSQTRTN